MYLALCPSPPKVFSNNFNCALSSLKVSDLFPLFGSIHHLFQNGEDIIQIRQHTHTPSLSLRRTSLVSSPTMSSTFTSWTMRRFSSPVPSSESIVHKSMTHLCHSGLLTTTLAVPDVPGFRNRRRVSITTCNASNHNKLSFSPFPSIHRFSRSVLHKELNEPEPGGVLRSVIPSLVSLWISFGCGCLLTLRSPSCNSPVSLSSLRLFVSRTLLFE